MSREIKFRAFWNGKMYNVISIDFLNKRVVIDDGLLGISVTFAKVKLMQYTGIKDKNDKEIYDCDIVKDTSGYIYKVSWQPYSASWKISNNISHFLFCMKYMDMTEVIGNVWENAKLLQE